MPISEEIQFCDYCGAMIAEGEPYEEWYGTILCAECADALHDKED